MDLFSALESREPDNKTPAKARKAPRRPGAAAAGLASDGRVARDPSPAVAASAPASDRAGGGAVAPEIGDPRRIAGPATVREVPNRGGVAVGDDVVYWSLYSGHFLAKVTAVRFMGEMVDVEVFGNNGVRIGHWTKIIFHPERSACIAGQAYKGERPKQ